MAHRLNQREEILRARNAKIDKMDLFIDILIMSIMTLLGVAIIGVVS